MNFVATTMQLPLHDIVDDHSVSWWPPAMGWWFVAATLLLALLGSLLWWRRVRRQQRQRRRVETLLEAPASSISELNLRLKQVLLLKYPRSALAHLHAQAWQQRLVMELPEKQRDNFLQQLMPYLDLQYQTHDQAAVNAYHELVITWWNMARGDFNKGLRHV